MKYSKNKNSVERRLYRMLSPSSTLEYSARKSNSKTSREHLKLVKEIRKFDTLKKLVEKIDKTILQLKDMRKYVRLLKNLRSNEL